MVFNVNCILFILLYSPPPKFKVTLLPADGSLRDLVVDSPLIHNGIHNALTAEEPFYAKIISNERVTDPDHFQDVRLIKFDVGDSNIR